MKNQLKKSLSLIMAVLMLMSCWVWVAPEKAEAASATGYEVKVNLSVSSSSGTYSVKVYYWPVSGNSFDTSKSISKEIAGGAASGASGEKPWTCTEGFPHKVEVYEKANDGTGSKVNITVKSISINGKTILSGDRGLGEKKDNATSTGTWGVDANGNKPSGQDNYDGTWLLPKFAFDATAEGVGTSISLAAPKYGSTTPNSETITGKFYDSNYDTVWLPGVSQDTPTLTNDLGKTGFSNVLSATISGASTTLTAKSGADRYGAPGAATSKWTLKLNYSSNGAAIERTLPVILEHPTYKIKLDTNGGNNSPLKEIVGDFYYGSNIFTVAGLTTLPGFKLDENSKPVPTDEVNKDNCQLEGWTSAKSPLNGYPEGSYESLNENTTVSSDVTFYARWATADINVKFETADGQEIATIVSKYGMSAKNKYGSTAELLNYVYNNKKTNDNRVFWSKVTTNDGEYWVPEWKQDGLTYRFNGFKIVEAKDMEGNSREDLKSGGIDTELAGYTVFRATYVPVTMTDYTIRFFGVEGDAPISSATYKYGADITVPSGEIKLEDPEGRYEYTHIGWAPMYSKRYYTVDENGLDENGGKIEFVDTTLPAEKINFIVEGNADYVPVFRREYIDYTVNYVYKTEGAVEKTATVTGVHLDDVLTVPEEVESSYTNAGFEYFITGWKLDENGATGTGVDISSIDVTGNMTVYADYNKVEAAKYIIKFYDFDKKVIGGEYDEEGNLLNEEDFIYADGDAVKVPTCGDGEGFDIPRVIDTEDKLYTFSKWSQAVSTTAGAKRDYYAIYDEQTYADITYYNGDNVIYKLDGKEHGIFVGEAVEEYNEAEYGIPEKAADKTGTYTFKQWVDKDGNTVKPGTTVLTGDLSIYADYDIEYINYTVIFANDDGTEISKNTYHYGQTIERPENEPTKDPDEKYTYKFRTWNPEISDKCYENVTYTAVYTKTYNYYPVTWYKDDRTTEVSMPYYIYGERIAAPTTKMDPADGTLAPAGHYWKVTEWIQCDKDGNPVDAEGNIVAEENAARYSNGMKMGDKPLYFYAKLELEEKTLEVKFYDETGKKYLGSEFVEYGKEIPASASVYKVAAKKPANENEHFSFTRWIYLDGTEVNTITADCSVKAVLTGEAHNPQIYDVVKYPTCTEPGIAEYKCTTDFCDLESYEQEIPVIPDFGAPSITVQLGDKTWPANSVVEFSEKQLVNGNTIIVGSAIDTNTRSQWNPEGELTRRVGKVDVYVSESIKADPSTIMDSDWINAYDYDLIYNETLEFEIQNAGLTQEQFNALEATDEKKIAIIKSAEDYMNSCEATIATYIKNLELEDGKDYIIYVRAYDRAVGTAAANVSYASTGWFNYGSTAATVTVSGDGLGTKFCADATIKVTDDTDGFTVKLDGEKITLDADGEYKCEAKGVHTVTVADKHGNITTKTFEIKGNHTNRQYVINATCENEGSRYNICTVCGAKTNEEVLPEIGHSYTANFVDKAPTCVVDGYRTYVCDNNCGTKLVIKPTDDAEKIAQAKKFVEAADGEEEGTWVALTAADIEHLKATGKHTYPKVKDKDGNETDELAWVIDKAATCLVEGSKHIDCTECGIVGRETEKIPVDKVNGHKFYREKVTLEPTCTAKGEKTKTCRYCGDNVKVADIDALGHIEGEYVVITPATCETAGSKKLTCARCSTEENPVYIAEAEDIPALGHAWKVDGKPEKMNKLDTEGNPVTDENGEAVQAWYQKYICANDNTHVKYDELEDYVEPVKATVTFKNGDVDVKVINGYVGNVITAAQVTEKPEKATDADYTYTFKGWATKNADGTYTDVNFPIEVKGDATYYAVYTEKFVNYTITYYKEDGATEFQKTGYLHNGDKVPLADGPSKAETTSKKYEFAGWLVIGSSPEVVLTKEATIAGANINLKATYTEKTKKYAVTYAYSKSDILETFEVDAGTEARACAITPVKKADSKNHYEFKAWNKAAQLASVESNIYTTPDFETIVHTYTHEGGIVTKSPATCDSNRIDTYTCTCGYTFDKEIPGTKREHVWGDRIVGTDGSVTKECTYEDCDAVDSKVETFTAKFFVNEADEKAIKTVSHIAWGTKIEAIQLPAAPTKENDANYTYTFKGWAVKGKTDVVDVTAIEIKADYEFVAIFTPTIREYNVIFAYDAYNTIETHTGVKAGSSVTFGGAKPTKVCDETKHYTFSGWIGYSGTEHNITITNIQSDLYILADFAGTKHEYKTYELSAATCTNGTGTRYWCDCNGNGQFDAKVNGAFVDHYEDKTGKPLPHNFEETKRVPATQHADGYVEYTCTVCKTVEKETLKYVDNVIDIKVTITVNGAAKSGIQVEIQPKDGVPFFATTNANGVASAEGTKGVSYTAYATIDGEKVQVTLKEDANGNITGSYNHEDKDVDCSCACHRNNVWGSIFRFFHKIIKLFTGKFKCCGNPDPMYG